MRFTIVTAKDIPGRNVVPLIMDDQPCLADGFVNHPEEPILLLAHSDRHILAKAVAAVQISYKPSPSIHSIEESERRDQIIWGKDNIFKSFLMEKGDVEKAWENAAKNAAWIVEGEYHTGAQEQLYIEPNGVIAQAGDTGGLTVWGSMQCPFYMHKALVALTGLAAEHVRVIQAETGGAFGGKEEYPSMLAGHASLLAMKSGRPVKMIYDRMEDMAATTKRHPSRTRHRTAVSADGKLLAGRDRVCHGWRRVRHLVVDRAFAGNHPRGGPLLLAEHSNPFQVLCDKHRAAARGFSRVRRPAKPVRNGTAHGPYRKNDRLAGG